MFTKLSEHFEFRHFRPHYLDVDTKILVGDKKLVIIMDKRKGYVLLLINAGVRNSVSERKKSRRLLHYV
jgi:hypothetical protein